MGVCEVHINTVTVPLNHWFFMSLTPASLSRPWEMFLGSFEGSGRAVRLAQCYLLLLLALSKGFIPPALVVKGNVWCSPEAFPSLQIGRKN